MTLSQADAAYLLNMHPNHMFYWFTDDAGRCGAVRSEADTVRCKLALVWAKREPWVGQARNT